MYNNKLLLHFIFQLKNKHQKENSSIFQNFYQKKPDLITKFSGKFLGRNLWEINVIKKNLEPLVNKETIIKYDKQNNLLKQMEKDHLKNKKELQEISNKINFSNNSININNKVVAEKENLIKRFNFYGVLSAVILFPTTKII